MNKSEITGLTLEEIKEIHKNTNSLQALDYLHRYALVNCKPKSVDEQFRRFLRNKVEQDLDVLDIWGKHKHYIRSSIYGCQNYKDYEEKYYNNTWLLRFDKPYKYTKDEFNKIKQWLEGRQ